MISTLVLGSPNVTSCLFPQESLYRTPPMIVWSSTDFSLSLGICLDEEAFSGIPNVITSNLNYPQRPLPIYILFKSSYGFPFFLCFLSVGPDGSETQGLDGQGKG